MVQCGIAGSGQRGTLMTVATDHRYIVRDDAILGGEPIIAGTRTPVRAPTTLAQVFDALSYFADHQAEIQAHIDQNRVPEELTHPESRPDG